MYTQSRHGQNQLCLEVSDSGIGMTDTQKGRLFQAFSQADASTTRQFGGTGLGLSICRHLVSLMQGDIAVHSQPGQGSVFTVTIPCEPASPGYLHNHFVPVTALQGKRILFADASSDFTHMMCSQALAWGMIALPAHSGQEALTRICDACAEGRPYDMAVLDLNLPDLDGLEIARQLARTPEVASTQRILLTPLQVSLVEQDLKPAKLALAMQKPASAAVLRNALLTLADDGPNLRTDDSRSDAGALRQWLAGRKLLVAEDNAVNQMVILGMLKKLDISATIADNGAEALQRYCSNPMAFDLVLMDCEMPELDGYETTRQLRQFEQQHQLRPIGIVALTAHAMREQQQRCLSSGMNDYLAKPLTFDRLRQVLVRALRTPDSTAATLTASPPETLR